VTTSPSNSLRPVDSAHRGIPDEPRILLIMLGLIGDTLMRIPVARAIRNTWPGAHIAAVCEPLTAPILAHNPLFDEVQIFDRRGLSYIQQAQFYWNLGRARHDVVIDLYHGARTPLMAWCTGAPRRVGLSGGRLNRWLFTDVVQGPLPAVHMVDRMLVMLEPLGIRSFDRVWEYPVATEVHESLHAKLAGAGIQPATRPGDIVFALGAGCETKRWDDEYVAHALRRVAAGELGEGRRLLVIADQRDPQLSDRWRADAGVVFLPPLSLLEIGALFRETDLVFVPDTGLMHVALGTARRLLTFFQSTDRNLHVADRGAYRALYHEVCPYQPCDTKDKDKCQLECRRSLGVDEVLTAASELLALPAWDGLWGKTRVTLEMVRS